MSRFTFGCSRIFLTKPLQGQLARILRNALLGLQHEKSIIGAPLVQTKERVESMRSENGNDIGLAPMNEESSTRKDLRRGRTHQPRKGTSHRRIKFLSASRR
jgi:hypothetical protein